MAQEFLEAAEAAARRAGEVLRYWAARITVSEKGPADLVTEADLASQAAIVDVLQGRFPEHDFLGEENLASARRSNYRWVIDPLDGTTNYVHRYPYYAVSIGLEQQGELLVGVVYDPIRDELYSALRGAGAYLNGQPMRASRVDDVGQALTVASLPTRGGVEHPAVQRFLKVLGVAQSVQRTGSSALNLAQVAAGRLDAYWSSTARPWDLAAGVLLVTEAGGSVTRMDGQPFSIEVPNLLATNGTALHGQLQELLR